MKLNMKYLFHVAALLSIFFYSLQNRDNDNAITINGHDEKVTKRFGMVTALKPEKVEYYKKLHAAVWSDVQRKIKECNIKNYSIFLKEIEGKPFLFSYFEYTGTNFNADMEKMAQDSLTKLWWKETDPCQQPLPDAKAKKQVWSEMDAIFFLN